MAGNRADHKSSKAQIEDRVNIIMEMLLSGLNRRDIIQKIAKDAELKEWNVNNRQVDIYIAKANEILSGTFERDRETLVDNFYNQYRYLYKKLIKAGDYKGAMLAVDRLAEFTGVKPNEKVDINLIQDKNIESLTFEQLMTLKYGPGAIKKDGADTEPQ